METITIYHFPLMFTLKNGETWFFNSKALHCKTIDELTQQTLLAIERDGVDLAQDDFPPVIVEEVPPFDFFVVRDVEDNEIIYITRSKTNALNQTRFYGDVGEYYVQGMYWDEET